MVSTLQPASLWVVTGSIGSDSTPDSAEMPNQKDVFGFPYVRLANEKFRSISRIIDTEDDPTF